MAVGNNDLANILCLLLLLLLLPSICSGDRQSSRYQLPAENIRRSGGDRGNDGQYQYEYHVSEDNSGNYFGHSERSDADGTTSGAYFVALPDGRLQRVDYTVEADGGFRARVTYDAANANSSSGRETRNLNSDTPSRSTAAASIPSSASSASASVAAPSVSAIYPFSFALATDLSSSSSRRNRKSRKSAQSYHSSSGNTNITAATAASSILEEKTLFLQQQPVSERPQKRRQRRLLAVRRPRYLRAPIGILNGRGISGPLD